MLVTALEANADALKMETVLERLLHEEHKTTENEPQGNSERAIAGRNYKKTSKKELVCYHC